MHSVEKLFAVVDRKLSAFDFNLKKVKGGTTGNEYYAVSGSCIVNGAKVEHNIITVGCPMKAIETVANTLLKAVNEAAAASDTPTPLLRKVEPETTGITLTPVSEEVAPGLKRVACECGCSDCCGDEFEVEFCQGCGEPIDECICGEDEEVPSITLTPIRTQVTGAEVRGMLSPTVSTQKAFCPYCGQRVESNHAYCPHCGNKQ